MNILQALRESTNFIKQVTNQSQIESKIEAEHIFMFILQVSKTKLFEQYDSILTDSNNKKIKNILELRRKKQKIKIWLVKRKL
jgi:uncharacterized protein (DUF2267 family)